MLVTYVFFPVMILRNISLKWVLHQGSPSESSHWQKNNVLSAPRIILKLSVWIINHMAWQISLFSQAWDLRVQIVMSVSEQTLDDVYRSYLTLLTSWFVFEKKDKWRPQQKHREWLWSSKLQATSLHTYLHLEQTGRKHPGSPHNGGRGQIWH